MDTASSPRPSPAGTVVVEDGAPKTAIVVLSGELTRLDALLPVCESHEAALAAIGAPA